MNRTFVTLLYSLALICATCLANAADSQPALTLEQLIAFVPGDTKLKNGSKWLPVGTAIATQSIRTNALKKRAELTVKVSEVKAHPYDGYAICLKSKPAPVNINGASIPVVVYAYFDSNNLAGLGALHPGDTATIVGTLNAAEVQPNDSRLFLELIFAQLKQPIAK